MTTANDRESSRMLRRSTRAVTHQRKGIAPTFLSVVLLVGVLILCSVRNTSCAWLTASTSFPRHYDGRCILSPTRSCHSKRTISFSSWNQDDNGEDDTIDSPKELKKAVHELSRLPNRQSTHPNVVAYSVPNLEALVDPTAKNDSTPIEGILGEYPEYPGRVTGDDSDEDADSDLDGWFLDTETYVNSRDHVNPDGSLDLDSHSSVDEDYRMLTESLLRMQTPNVPASFLQKDEKEPTLESLWQQPPQDPSATSEELHRKVFEHEDGYLQQSEFFRKSLTGDSAASLEAAQWRRGADYRHRQEEALAKLNQEMDAFIIHLEEESRKNKQRCFKCGCALSPEEVEHTKSMQASQRLCSICYGDLLVAKSDRSFFRDAAPPPPFRQGNQTTWRAASGPRQYRTKVPNNAVAHNVPDKSHVSSAPRVERQDKMSDDDDIEMLKKEVKALQDELHHLKEGEVIPDAEEATGSWSQVIDPDTGEVFYWNDETEEMRWEMEE